jgi:hypothetical protein
MNEIKEYPNSFFEK